jgi:hypothetical protein
MSLVSVSLVYQKFVGLTGSNMNKTPHPYDFEFLVEFLDTEVEPARWQTIAMLKTEAEGRARYQLAIRASVLAHRLIKRFSSKPILTNEPKRA